MIVTSVQIKTAKMQKHLYCPVFTQVHRNFDRITVDFFYARKPLEIKTFAVFEHKRTPPQSDFAAGFCALHGFCGFFVVVIVKQLG